jgi:hypothetical protein
MKKIIGGRVYNTETAELLGDDSSHVGRSDFHWYEEGLYRTKKGAYFLAGEGGAMTGYAKSYDGGNSYGGGELLTLLTEAEAREWMEAHSTPDAYEAAFGAAEEG